MKLSQKLLALGGVTLADYACCPYDDYGMPHAACTTALPEKTPFSMETDWRDGACKAWESNVDATYDGNDNSCGTNENWGSCGFQRHFPWNDVDTESFRNRNCVVSFDGTNYNHGTGCNCNNFADSATNYAGNNAIACKSTTMVASTNDSPALVTCSATVDRTTHAGNTQTDFTNGNICCDSSFDTVQYLIENDNTTPRIDCLRECAAADTNGLATCYETDLVGKRNIQQQNLYFRDEAAYTGVSTSSISFAYDADATASTGATSNANLYNLGGVPFLGGICKLFVPVPRSRITSVQIAGVHVNLSGSSVFAAKVGSAATYNANDHVGTAYCFSVVNPAEGMNNSNGIHNGNVAGGAVDTVNNNFDQLAFALGDTSLTRQAGIEPNINFFDGSDGDHIGTQLNQSNPVADGDSEVGANFDVVVHIHSEWCNSQSFWDYSDMQLTGDYNNGNDDYPLNVAPGTDQRTAAAYSEGQTGPLQLTQLRNTVTTKTTDEATALTTYTNGALATFNGGTCGTALALNVGCSASMATFFNAYVAEGACNEATPGECADEAAATATATAALYLDTNNDGTFDDGCFVTDLSSDCTITGTGVTEVDTLLTGADPYATAVGERIAAENAVTAALQANNGFTHAHMDLMDKRHNMVATWNKIYESDGNGYLQFPHSDDDAFVTTGGAKGTYTAATGGTYLRWPNAGAFAAFYSFVACSNPPYIAETDTSVVSGVNRYSIIYNNANQNAETAPDTDPTTNNHYDHYGKENLLARTVVMSQSDSDYRDEKCDERIFRGNLRQVGNDVTVCGPGQLPDTDNKRCSWNWNYQSSSDVTVANESGGNAWTAPNAQNPSDAEEWFDRNDPHSFDMWSTRKRRSGETSNNRKYAFNAGYWGAQQGKTGTAPEMWNGAVAFNAELAEHGAAIEIPITDYNFNINFKTAADAKPSVPVVSTNTAGCWHNGNTCVCKPSYQELTGLTTKLTGDAITIDETTDLDAIFGVPAPSYVASNVAHSSCLTPAACTDAEALAIKANLQLAQACDGYKSVDGTLGFFQTDNIQRLVFDDSRVVTAYHPGNDEWEVSVQCTRVNMASIDPTTNVSQRDLFPDCFFGDELWFTFSYSTSENNGNDALFQYNSYVSAWTTELKDTAQEYMTT